VTTQVEEQRFSALALAAEPQLSPAEAELRYYTPEEVVAIFKLPVSVRWLKETAYARKFGHAKVAGKLAFRLQHLRLIAESLEVPALATGRRPA